MVVALGGEASGLGPSVNPEHFQWYCNQPTGIGQEHTHVFLAKQAEWQRRTYPQTSPGSLSSRKIRLNQRLIPSKLAEMPR